MTFGDARREKKHKIPSPEIFPDFPNIPDIAELDEAKEAIRKAIERGEWPLISVPQEYVEAAKNGIRPHSTWIGEVIIAGTILRPPYLPVGKKRKVFRIKVNFEQIEPRFTGEDGHFHGVVVFNGPITAEAMEEIAV